jgi:hypothetical protein
VTTECTPLPEIKYIHHVSRGFWQEVLLVDFTAKSI